MLYVLAGNYGEVQDLCKKLRWNPANVRYITCVNLAGTRHVPYVRYGTWYNRDDIAEVSLMLMATEAIEVRSEEVLELDNNFRREGN